MALALEEARKSLGCTSPNPPVGAVIVKGGRMLASGRHRRAGLPHAEIEALDAVRRGAASARAAATLLRGAAIYITLEPCSTAGRTPPCTDALIDAGLARVVYGARDPNPLHSGRAARLLGRSGIEVTAGILEEECRHVIRMFDKFIRTGRPYVIAKSALTLDGRITPVPGASPWITGPEARRDVQRLRSQVDAILVGGETLRRDNPRLTLRGEFARLPRPQPWRIIQTRRDRLPGDLHVFTDRHRDRTLVFRNRSLTDILRELGKRGVCSLLLEAGGNLTGQAFKKQIVDEVWLYYAPRIGGGDVRAVAGAGFCLSLTNMRIDRVGTDVRIIGVPEYPDKRTQEGRAAP